MTVNTTCPGVRRLSPSCIGISLQLGGKIELTRTRLNSAIPALRKANSKEVSFSRCLPTPLVRKIPLAIGPIRIPLQHQKFSITLVSSIGAGSAAIEFVKAVENSRGKRAD